MYKWYLKTPLSTRLKMVPYQLPPLFRVLAALVLLCGAITVYHNLRSTQIQSGTEQEVVTIQPAPLPKVDHIQNFKVTGRNGTHVTFSWDVVDGHYSSDYINYFHLHYKERNANWSSLYIPYIITTQTHSPSPTFHFTTRTFTFGKEGQYTMQLSVYRHRLNPRTLYSGPVQVDLGEMRGSTIFIEMNIKLWPYQSCYVFIEQSSSVCKQVQHNIYMRFSEHSDLPYKALNTSVSYFMCSLEGYITFRAHMFANNATIHASALKGALRKWLHGKNTDKSITIYGRRHFVEPGPCGETIPHLFAPECNHHSDSEMNGCTERALGSKHSVLTVHGMCSL